MPILDTGRGRSEPNSSRASRMVDRTASASALRSARLFSFLPSCDPAQLPSLPVRCLPRQSDQLVILGLRLPLENELRLIVGLAVYREKARRRIHHHNFAVSDLDL
jgi:hypothetical protein